MDSKETEYFKALLNAQFDKLLAQADLTLSELVFQSGQEIEYLDRAAVHTNQSLRLKIKVRESKLIKKIQLSLERIENGTYGSCEECGEEISIKRLEARPVTTKCIDCKEDEEKLELLEKYSHN